MPSMRFVLTLLVVSVPPTAAMANGALANPLCGLNSVYCFYSAGTITSTDSSTACSDRYSVVSITTPVTCSGMGCCAQATSRLGLRRAML
jgi:hypothetical protein